MRRGGRDCRVQRGVRDGRDHRVRRGVRVEVGMRWMPVRRSTRLMERERTIDPVPRGEASHRSRLPTDAGSPRTGRMPRIDAWRRAVLVRPIHSPLGVEDDQDDPADQRQKSDQQPPATSIRVVQPPNRQPQPRQEHRQGVHGADQARERLGDDSQHGADTDRDDQVGENEEPEFCAACPAFEVRVVLQKGLFVPVDRAIHERLGFCFCGHDSFLDESDKNAVERDESTIFEAEPRFNQVLAGFDGAARIEQQRFAREQAANPRFVRRDGSGPASDRRPDRADDGHGLSTLPDGAASANDALNDAGYDATRPRAARSWLPRTDSCLAPIPAMRILHTSDWHLGVQLHDASLEAEQRLFLDWLIETIEQQEIDALIVAGDIFHHAQPSNAARRLLNQFFMKAQRCRTLRCVILTAGNHDSASTLETPGPLLDAARVHVISDARAAMEDVKSFLVPLRDARGTVRVVVSALPYIHSWHLGIRSAEMSLAEEREATIEAFRALYEACADEAAAAWPDAVRIATGHLTCGEPRAEDFVTKVHGVGGIDSVGGIEAFGTDIFGERYAYVALGHIHRHMPVADHVWYAGTPVATRFTEAESPRYVRVVEVAEDNTVVQRALPVPVWRELPRFRGSPDEVEAAIRAFESHAPLAPYAMIEVELDDVGDGGLRERCQASLPDGARIVSFAQRKRAAWAEEHSERETPNLDDVTLEALFVRLYEERNNGQSPPESVMRAFRQAEELTSGGAP